MAYSAPQGERQVSGVHSLAIRTEIGERLRSSLDMQAVALPPVLCALMSRLGASPDEPV